VTLRIDISGLPAGRLRFAVSPLAELTAMLHVLAEPGHHPQLAGWAADVWAGLRPELAERLREAEFLWRSSRADFLVPARPRPTLAEELDDVDRIDDETYVTAALITTCGSNRVHFGAPSPLADATARERALDLAQARGALQEAFAERLLADPAAVRARVRDTLEQCAEAFFDAAWTGVAGQLATDLRLKDDLLQRQGLGAALASVSGAVALAPDGTCIVVDKLQDNATAAHGTGVTFPSPASSAARTWWRSTRPGGSRWCSTPSPRRACRSRFRWRRSRFGWRRSRTRFGCGCCAPWPAARTPPESWLTLGSFRPRRCPVTSPSCAARACSRPGGRAGTSGTPSTCPT
jgi:uncharacterized protein DUF5937